MGNPGHTGQVRLRLGVDDRPNRGLVAVGIFEAKKL